MAISLTFKRYFKIVDGQPIGVDVYLDGAYAGKVRIAVVLTPSQVIEINL